MGKLPEALLVPAAHVLGDHLGHDPGEPGRLGGSAATDVRDGLSADVGDAGQRRAVDVPAQLRVAQAVELLEPFRQDLLGFLRIPAEVAAGPAGRVLALVVGPEREPDLLDVGLHVADEGQHVLLGLGGLAPCGRDVVGCGLGVLQLGGLLPGVHPFGPVGGRVEVHEGHVHGALEDGPRARRDGLEVRRVVQLADAPEPGDGAK